MQLAFLNTPALFQSTVNGVQYVPGTQYVSTYFRIPKLSMYISLAGSCTSCRWKLTHWHALHAAHYRLKITVVAKRRGSERNAGPFSAVNFHLAFLLRTLKYQIRLGLYSKHFSVRTFIWLSFIQPLMWNSYQQEHLN